MIVASYLDSRMNGTRRLHASSPFMIIREPLDEVILTVAPSVIPNIKC